MKKIAAILCAAALTLSIGAVSVSADDITKGITIGVAVYNPDDAQTKAFRTYYEDYLGQAFDAEFLYSDRIQTWEEEKAFIDALHERGVKGIISSQSLDREAVMELCQEYGMYYIFGSSSLSDEVFDTLKDNPYFLGTIGASEETEKQAGIGMADFFASEDTAKEHSYLICTGGASLGNEMHRLRSLAMLEELAKIYGMTYETPAKELVMAEELTEAANDAGIKIVILPGFPYRGPLEENTATVLADGSIDTVMSSMVTNSQMDAIREAEKANDINIRVGSVDCFTEEAYDYFNGTESGGVQELDYLVGRYGACVAPAFVAICNACAGYAEDFREDGHAFRLEQNFWTASSVEEFNKQYELSVGLYINTYSATDIMSVLKQFTPDTDFEDFKAFAER